jgi:hypothetical protein
MMMNDDDDDDDDDDRDHFVLAIFAECDFSMSILDRSPKSIIICQI